LPSPAWPEVRRAPQSFVGLHFFSPVEKMPLVEIIRGEETGEAAARARARLRQAHPQDAHRGQRLPGFYTSRAFGTCTPTRA
jgi:3-hydroxyacyl-CoA dehydrogenase/enoyl-CoA hydratase/3-hydroxybutyryl-CoA epimerase